MPRKSDGGSSSKKRKIEQDHLDLIEDEYQGAHHYIKNNAHTIVRACDAPLDIESVDPDYRRDELVEQDIDIEDSLEERQMDESLRFQVTKKVARSARKRNPLPDNPDGSRQRYYDRYKNQEYVKRNDVFKYCQVCRKKVHGRLRSLPSEHRLRRIWILRLNLDMERSAELWSREAFSDATHCGEICSQHFRVGSENHKNREILPIDKRIDATDMISQDAILPEDEAFDFDTLELECVYCDSKNILKNMIPFIRTRSRRYKWINALTGELDNNMKLMLQERLKNGDSKFLCDFHFSDADFEINQYGEWKLRKDAIPNPHLTLEDKKGQRIYMVNHGDTILSRTIETRRRDEEMYTRKDYRYMAQKTRQTTYANYYGDYGQYQYECQNLEGEGEENPEEPLTEYMVEAPLVEQAESHLVAGPSRVIEPDPDYSDDSDDEYEMQEKPDKSLPNTKIEPHSTRFCHMCNRVFASDRSMREYRPRTWPYDEPKHLRWMELMNFARDTEARFTELWKTRRNAVMSDEYIPSIHSLNVCQSHMELKNLQERYHDWLHTYCILCDQDLADPNLLLPFPRDRRERLLWLGQLVSMPTVNKANDKRWKWLKTRLTREKPTRYRLCVYHFKSDCFLEKEDCVEFNDASLPLPLGLPEYDLTPRGIWGHIKCPLCDQWKEHEELVDIRSPGAQYERVLLVELFIGDKTLMKKGVEQLCLHPCRICKSHIPEQISDPYSVIAERKLVRNIEIQCLQCDRKEMGEKMIPVPFDVETRRFWVEALTRDELLKERLFNRLNVVGRHYLCKDHFFKSGLRFIPSLGVWKRFDYVPLPLPADSSKYIAEEEEEYHPLIVRDIDDEGVVIELNYDEVLALLEEGNEITYAETDYSRPTTSNLIKMKREKQNSESEQGPPILEPVIDHQRHEDYDDIEDVIIEEEIDMTDEQVIVDGHEEIHEEELHMGSVLGETHEDNEQHEEYEEEEHDDDEEAPPVLQSQFY